MNSFQNHPNFILKAQENKSLNTSFRKRYQNISEDYKTFMRTFSSLANTADTTWFNSTIDFNETNSDSAFKWNEFEL